MPFGAEPGVPEIASSQTTGQSALDRFGRDARVPGVRLTTCVLIREIVTVPNRLASFVLCFVLAMVPLAALAQNGTKLAVLDVQRIYRDSDAAKALREEIDVGREKTRAVLAEQEKDILADDKALKQQRSILSPEAYAQQSQELGKRVNALKRQVAEARKANEQKYESGIKEIQKAVIGVVSEIAKERNLDLVLASNAIVLQSAAIEITEETMARLNARLPRVKGQ